jgi:undecaprenyl-diphosphatase
MIWLDRDRAAASERPALPLDALDWRRALAIGALQCVAMWPGTSRSMMTIAGGTLVGLRPRDAAEFSFLVGVPTLGGACAFKLAKNLLASARDGTPNLIETLGAGSVAIGIAVATLSAAIAVRWLVSFLNRHGLAAFGWYRIGLSAVMAIAFYLGWVQIS